MPQKQTVEHFFAPCPRGLEGVLCEELSRLGAASIEASRAGVAFAGPFEVCYRANLESRIASRVLWRVHACHYRTENDIYAAAHRLQWPDWFGVGYSMMVEVNARRCPLKSLDFVTLRIKDAICDRFRATCGARPNVNTREPDVRVHAFLDEQYVTLYLDTSGEPLFKRGYRGAGTEAPLKENLASGIIQLTDWRPDEPFFDPMCGSGTFLIEAALMALNIAPGLSRSFAFQKLNNFSEAAWRLIQQSATEREQRQRELRIYGSDKYGEILKVARANLAAAQLAEVVQIKQANALEVPAPARSGVLVVNPPYGIRSGEQQELAAFYPSFGDALKQRFAGWRAYIFTADTRLPDLIRLKATKRTPLYNGPLECRLYEYLLREGPMRKRDADGRDEAGTRQSD